MAQWTQKLMDENKPKRKKSKSVKMLILLHDCRNTTILSVTVTWQTFQSSISFVTYFSHHAKTFCSSYTMAFNIKVIVEEKAAQKSLKIMDLVSPWCDAGEGTRWQFFLASLRCLQNVQIWVLVFESQTLGYKFNPVSCEKVSQTFVSNTEKIARLIGEEIW